jgi:hypothetical protein
MCRLIYYSIFPALDASHARRNSTFGLGRPDVDLLGFGPVWMKTQPAFFGWGRGVVADGAEL